MEYELSELGSTLIPVLTAMCDWSSDYIERNGNKVCGKKICGKP